MAIDIPAFTLNDGTKIPSVGMGYVPYLELFSKWKFSMPP
jgi:hypothetical protein